MNNSFHKVLKELRAESKKTQTEVAKELNITQRTYSNYETGRREPSIDMLIDIANYYKIPIDVLVGRYAVMR
ncbi:MAG: helix-turn-helix domain-containing protein [Ruminococcus flavefaciens]|nr:helix-turn-helix domain-containing protein [Ruminococcus flavefaciens]